jgi:protein required for attachment to host cells
MNTQCILVADRARARILIATNSNEESSLREHLDLVSPEASIPDKDLFRGSRARGRASRSGTGSAHGLDDGREAHREETARRFAKEVAVTLRATLAPLLVTRLVVVAEPHFLGLLRPLLRAMVPKSLEFVELAEDLSWHSLAHIKRVLEKKALLPARSDQSSASGPRGRRPAASKQKPRAARTT